MDKIRDTPIARSIGPELETAVSTLESPALKSMRFADDESNMTVAASEGAGSKLAAKSGTPWPAKIAFVLFCFLWVRATLPRFRYDQLMRLGWKVFLPFSLFWLVLTAGVLTAAGWLPAH